MAPDFVAADAKDFFLRDIEAKKGVPSFSNRGFLRKDINVLDIRWTEITAVSTESHDLLIHHPTDTAVSSFLKEQCRRQNIDHYGN